MNNIRVKKRDGSLKPIDIEKIHRVVEWACEGKDASASLIVLRAQLEMYDGIETSDIHAIITKAAADLISAETPDYQSVAANLKMFELRKVAYGDYTPPHLLDHVKKMVEGNWYDKDLLNNFSKEEWDAMNDMVDHSLDFKYSYAAVKQFEGKYLVRNRVTHEIYETPQFAYILTAATLHMAEKKDRMQHIRRFYNQTAAKRLSLPTPIMAGARTKTKQFSSCVKIECGDSLKSINKTASSIAEYISQRAGIGINTGAIRALGSPIRGGEAFHTGLIPFYKYFHAATKCCSQGGVRGGAATIYYPMWHREFESLIVLKNNKGVEENRVRGMDYGVQLNRLMYQRLVANGEISFFSPSDVPNLLEAFYSDQAEFERLYTMYEADKSIQRETMKATEAFSVIMQERASTGRIYIQNIDHCNTHGSFDELVAPVKMSNLCLEIALPTKPLSGLDEETGEIALCTLSAFNLGEFSMDSLHELEETADVAVRALDNLLSYQDYPMKAAEIPALARRALGVGVINYAHFLAKNGVKYSDGSANDLTHKLFEAIQFYLIKASVKLAKEKGKCDWFHETKYAKGILPIDTYKKDVDTLVNVDLELDWEALRADVVKFGMRNSTLSALMPSETSSQIFNATNGIEPPRGLVSVKSSKDGPLRQIVPEIKTLKDAYELLWDMPSNQGYLELVAIMQKFVDQAISANTNYDPSKFEDAKVPMNQLLKDLLTAYKFGVKTLYYHNTRDGASDPQNAGTEVKKEEKSAPAVEEVYEDDDDECGGGCKI